MLRLVGPRAGAVLFGLAVVAYSVNLREISSRDTIPNRLLLLAVVLPGTVPLEPFLGGYAPGTALPDWAVEACGR